MPPLPTCALAIAALLGFTGVGAGAFGAHALRAVLSDAQVSLWQTAGLYHLLHAVALAAVAGPMAAALAQAPGPDRLAPVAAALCVIGFGTGVLLFSGSLYALALGAPRAWGVVTPIGGLMLLLGWAAVLALAWRTGGP
jgi:uncharacterized membrane protein YgdD (TMEM256/DUF423 family)